MCYMNPKDNPYIPEATKAILRALPPRERKRFWEGLFGDAVDGPLWTYESIERMREDKLPGQLTRVIVAVDPSGCHGPEDTRSDEVGIIVAGKDLQGQAHILEDASGRLGPGGKDGWGRLVTGLYHKYKADFVVAEVNYGGSMVQAVIEASDPDVPFKEVHAARGKAVRADPVATLSDKGRVKLCGQFPELEQQMLQFSTNGFSGDRSPDRADAMVWAVWDLLVDKAPGEGMLSWYMQQAAGEIALEADKPDAPPKLVLMLAPTLMRSTIHSRNGRCYQIQNGSILVDVEDVEDMTRLGFQNAAGEPPAEEKED